MPLRRVLLWVTALAVLAAVFAAYLRPDLMRDMADFLWSCF
jgi:cytochrome b561